MSPDRSRKAKRADRPRGGPSRPEPAREPAPESTRLAETEAELEAEVDAAAEELRESGVAHRIATGEREAVQDALPAAGPAAAVGAREPVRTAAGRTVAPGASASQLPYVDDRVSKLWVALVALVFAGVLAYAFLGGKGGYLTRTPSPSPTPGATASPNASGSPSATPAATPTATAS